MMRNVPPVLPDEPPLEIEPASLQLDGYFVRELHYAVRDGFGDEAHLKLGTGLHVQPSQIMVCPPITTKLEVHIGQSAKDQSKFRLMLRVSSDEAGEESPYIFNVLLVGYFSHNAEPYIGMEISVFRNAVMILYSTVREIIASATGRGPFPALILPTLTFDIKESVRAAVVEKAISEFEILQKNKKSRQISTATKKTSKKRSGKSNPK